MAARSKEIKSCFLRIRERDSVIDIFDRLVSDSANAVCRERCISIQDVGGTERLEESFVLGRRRCDDRVETR